MQRGLLELRDSLRKNLLESFPLPEEVAGKIPGSAQRLHDVFWTTEFGTRHPPAPSRGLPVRCDDVIETRS